MSWLKPHPPKKRTLMCGPLTPNVSLRYMASQMDSRVFSSAHTPVSPPGFSSRESMVFPSMTPAIRLSTVPSTTEVVLAVRAAGVVRVGARGHAELVGVVAAGVLPGYAVFVGLAGKTSLNVINAADFRRKTEQATEHLVAGEFVVGRQQRMSFGRTL